MDLSSRASFQVIYNLQKKQPWLLDNPAALEELLFSDCPEEKHRSLILDLINRFEYFSNNRYMETLSDLALEISTDPNLTENSTQVVAMAAGSGADSSQHVLYELKRLLEKNNWRDYLHVNNFSRAYRAYTKNNSHKNIVLIDEFIGTGDTVLNRVREIQNQFKNVHDYTLRVKVLVAMESGISKIQSAGINVSSIVTLKKGISDSYHSGVLENMIDLMLDLEKLLKTSYKGRDLPSLGYGKAESLYCRERGNTPNSVFPIFWWPFYNNEKTRKTMLTRAMGNA